MLVGTVNLKLSGLSKLISNLKSACSYETRVGIFEESTYANGIPVAYVAYLNEYGGHNPPRPFFKRTQEKQQDKWINVYEGALKGGVTPQSVTTAQNRIGQTAAQDIQITAKKWNPSDPRMNKPSTIRAKERKSSGSHGKNQVANDPTRVLHDTGVMINSVIYRVVKK